MVALGFFQMHPLKIFPFNVLVEQNLIVGWGQNGVSSQSGQTEKDFQHYCSKSQFDAVNMFLIYNEGISVFYGLMILSRVKIHILP